MIFTDTTLSYISAKPFEIIITSGKHIWMIPAYMERTCQPISQDYNAVSVTRRINSSNIYGIGRVILYFQF